MWRWINSPREMTIPKNQGGQTGEHRDSCSSLCVLQIGRSDLEPLNKRKSSLLPHTLLWLELGSFELHSRQRGHTYFQDGNPVCIPLWSLPPLQRHFWLLPSSDAPIPYLWFGRLGMSSAFCVFNHGGVKTRFSYWRVSGHLVLKLYCQIP